MSDGGLRKVFECHLPGVHWQSIETGGTGRGIPDLNGCCEGVEVWIELKSTMSWRVKVRPEQVAWIERRHRAGGRVFLATRQVSRRRDDLWLTNWESPRMLIDGMRLDSLPPHCILGLWRGGPAQWNWAEFARIMEWV